MNSEFKFDFCIKNVHSQCTIKFTDNYYVDIIIIPNVYQHLSLTINFTIPSFRTSLQEHLLNQMLYHIGRLRMNQLSRQFINRIEQLCYHSLTCYDSVH